MCTRLGVLDTGAVRLASICHDRFAAHPCSKTAARHHALCVAVSTSCAQERLSLQVLPFLSPTYTASLIADDHYVELIKIKGFDRARTWRPIDLHQSVRDCLD